jgi:hypothetical protein
MTLALLVTPVFAKGRSSGKSKSSKEHVSGYTTKNGTKVKAYDRTPKNGTEKDNWSTKGNVNPETGKKGTKNPKN